MIIAGNWKMNLTRAEAHSLAGEVAAVRRKITKPSWDGGVDIILFPPFTMLDVVREAIGDSGVMLGGQDCHHEESGAHTGDVSATMLKDAGCDWVLLGHSERRQNHGESNGLIAKKVKQARNAGLDVMLCVGETLQERESGKAEDVVKKQLEESIPPDARGFKAMAYEPVWSIGTGKIPSDDEITAMQNLVFKTVQGRGQSTDLRVLYGGSVNINNATHILNVKYVRGALVGGASLKAEDFIGVMNAAVTPRHT